MKPYFKVLFNWARFQLLHFFVAPGVKIKGILMLGYNTRVSVKRTSILELGKHIVSDGRLTIIVDKNAKLLIGEGVYFNEGTMISAKSEVKIGEGCQFGPNVKIFDNNHQFSFEHGVLHKHSSCPVIIGKNCWIASNVTILRGASIGDRCVIGAGCIVKESIPEGSIVTQECGLKIRRIES